MNDKKKILIIEDEKDMADILKTKITASGYDVDVADDGRVGLGMALQMHPDLILLDIQLPSMDGISLLEELRNDEWGKNVPVIILSNLDSAETIEEGKSKGVRSYLVKTNWKLDEVVTRIDEELKSL